MQEFRQYPHYMQPRIHKMIQEVIFLPSFPIDARPAEQCPRCQHWLCMPHVQYFISPDVEVGVYQIGYCGLDKESLGAGPDRASLDIEDYCMGYVTWDLLMMFLQVPSYPSFHIAMQNMCSGIAPDVPCSYPASNESFH